MRGMEDDGLILLEDVDSTQNEVRRRLAAGVPSPVWVMARRQTAGRGRKGRQWISHTGNLHLSVGLELAIPAAWLPQISFVAALAAHKAVSAVAQRHGQPALQSLLALKWPNDLLLAGRKLGGVLLESEPSGPAGMEREVSGSMIAKGAPEHRETGPQAHRLIVGWGINLANAPPDSAVRWPAVCLLEAGLEVSPRDVALRLRDYFARWLTRWQADGFAPVRAAWERRAWGLGLVVTVQAGPDVHRGRLVGLAHDGALVLEDDRGEPHAIHAGEILHADSDA